MFEQIRNDILKTGANVFRIALYRDGEWREETLRPVCPCLNCYSLSKNFTATAIGIASDMGLLTLDDYIIKFLPDELPERPDERLGCVKIRHLLSQTMGCAEGHNRHHTPGERHDAGQVPPGESVPAHGHPFVCLGDLPDG